MAALQRSQLERLCSNPETLEKAQSIMRLVSAKTRPGSGFVIKNTIAIPAVCAYLASQRLNTGEVSLQSAMSAACVTQAEFTSILNKVGTALQTEEESTSANLTYEMLVDTYRIHPREDVVACMEDAEAALPHVDLMKERYGTNALTCAVFYWVCQLLEEPAVQERSFRQNYSIPSNAFKAILTTLDKQCDSIAEQIRSHVLEKRSSLQGSVSPSRRALASPQKSPVRSSLRPQPVTTQIMTPTMTPSKKRAVTFSRVPLGRDGNYSDAPETPTKKRRVDASPIKPSTGNSSAKYPTAAATAAFHAAIRGSPIKPPAGQESGLPVAGPSTPNRPRHTKATAMTPSQADSQPSPSRSQGQTSPTRPAARRRFRPVFLEQQQWYARDPKVERMWAVVERLREATVPFQPSHVT